ncbi:uncharacterized protein LOC135076940 [Ostrinia nubilalis]|uniref:uncharacterized protein LOC135076940 n=1 Tax=Ostrinia nubilalis TaxID=29057 RepID=UPI003082535D
MMTDSSNFGSVQTNVVRQPHTSSSATVAGSSQTDNHFVIAKCRRNTDVPSNQNATNNQESTEDSDIEEKILVVYCRAGKLGAAYYTLQTGELQILDEIVDRPPEFLMFLNLFRQVAPSRVLLDGKTQGAFVQAVKKTVFDCDRSSEGSCKLMFISAREYSK